jgi:hypothetical protein
MVQVDWIEAGETRVLQAGDQRPAGPPVMLPMAQDAIATAAYIQSVLSGEQPVPENVARQVGLILGVIAVPTASERQPDTMAKARPHASPQ